MEHSERTKSFGFGCVVCAAVFQCVFILPLLKASCVGLPVRMEAVVWPMRKEIGAVIAGLISLESAVKLTTAQTTA